MSSSLDRTDIPESLRGGREALDQLVVLLYDEPEQLLELNDALDELARLDGRLARVVEYRFFGGMTSDEIAEVLKVTTRTVEREWVKARALLRETLSP